jgi:CRP-like cAMP-binding protein
MTDEEKDEQFYRDTESIAFVKLDDRQLALLDPLGKRRTLRRGEFVFKAGQRDLGLTVILRGEIEVLRHAKGRNKFSLPLESAISSGTFRCCRAPPR